MNYTYLQEITKDWNCDYRVPNHTYIMFGSKCAGYIKEGTTKQIMFFKPMMFDKRKRKFKTLKL